MNVKLHPSWKSHLAKEFKALYFQELTEYVKSEYRSAICYPPGKQIFAAFDHCPFEKIKVVILGQDPYHGPGQANGLCFSVNEGVALPPSLLNIYKEIQSDLGKPISKNGDLGHWADQGVLLLNATLTVRANLAGSHQNKGWESFTDAVINAINEEREHVVFMLWGNFARKKGNIIDAKKHLVLTSAHPSPLSAYNGFFGCRHFSKANEYLIQNGIAPIEW